MKKEDIVFYATGVVLLGTAVGCKIVKNYKYKQMIIHQMYNHLVNKHDNKVMVKKPKEKDIYVRHYIDLNEIKK